MFSQPKPTGRELSYRIRVLSRKCTNIKLREAYMPLLCFLEYSKTPGQSFREPEKVFRLFCVSCEPKRTNIDGGVLIRVLSRVSDNFWDRYRDIRVLEQLERLGCDMEVVRRL